MNNADLESLSEGLKRHDMHAFRQIFDMYSKSICGAIHVIVKNEPKAEEICQDVFVTVWEKSHQYDASKGRLFTWILNIARNRAIDYVRSRAFKEEKQNLSGENAVGILEGRPMESEIEETRTSQLQARIQGLSRKCVEIIEYLYFRGYTQKAVSEELDIPLGTIKTRNRDCIGRLRKNMQPSHGQR